VYRSDVIQVVPDGAGQVRGQIVAVTNRRRAPLGYALYSDRSEIALRMLARGGDPPSLATFGDRIDAAVRYRESLGIDATAYRLVHGEADRLPGLVVDRYGDVLVLQALVQGVDRLLPDLTTLLVERLRPAGILARNDPRVRLLEGLDRRVEVLHGSVPDTIEVREGRVTYEVDPHRGQKTGLFLDQRENHLAARRYARGRVLDAFCYDGGFALQVARDAEHVTAVDLSEEALERV
jgi:23S rRNA (cytosine1962-C5)-methyltransferase